MLLVATSGHRIARVYIVGKTDLLHCQWSFCESAQYEPFATWQICSFKTFSHYADKKKNWVEVDFSQNILSVENE